MHRITLYKQIENQWHYVRISTMPERQVLTETGLCGQYAKQQVTQPLPEQREPLAFLRELATVWAERGYSKPLAKQLPVMTLHFQLPYWAGYPAGAPWYDDWTQDYLDPITQFLEDTCNGSLKGNERFSGNHLFYFSIFDETAARTVIADISQKAMRKHPLALHIGSEEKNIKIPLDPNIPDYLRSLFRTMEKTARLLRDLPDMVQGDPLQPLLVTTPNRRVRGEQAAQKRQTLKEKWNFTSNLWDPLVMAAPSETVFLNGLTDEKKQTVSAAIMPNLKLPVYLLDCETGLFEITPEQIFEGAYEGVVFDDSNDWLIYFSHHYTTTFCGDWLVKAVKTAYADEPEALKTNVG